MKRCLFTIILLLTIHFGHSQNDTILIDFGNILSPLPWNNVTNPWNGEVDNLINSDGINTAISVSVIDSFNYINTNGTPTPSPDLNIVSTASEDSFFGNDVLFSGDVQPTAGIELSNLDVEKEYTLSIFASRITSQNRETQYIIQGETTDTFFLNVASNTDQVITSSLFPDEEGNIQVLLSPGPNNENEFGFYYLNALQLIYEEEEMQVPPSIALQVPNGGEYWQAGKTVHIYWESENVGQAIIEYSLDGGLFWAAVDTVFASVGKYEWQVPEMPTDQAMIRISADLMHDESDEVFEISLDTTDCPIVVLGSSTAAGVGPSSTDSTWVNRYRRATYNRDTRYPVYNLGKGGYTTYHILPDDAIIPDGINVTIDSSRNFSEALSYDPYAVIVNMPSNDAANFFSVEQQLGNFDLMVETGETEGVDVYICTTQPRNFGNDAQIQIQEEMKTAILDQYGSFAIDFWTGIADTMGWVLPIYDSGDGVHLNDAGHQILSDRVIQKQLDTTICNSVISSILPSLEQQDIPFKFYPNPFTDHLNLQLTLSQNTKVDVKLISLLGHHYGVYSWNLFEGDHHLSLKLPKTVPSYSQFLIAVIRLEVEGEIYIKQQKILRVQ